MGVKETGMDFWRAQWADQIGRSFFHARFMFSLLCTCKSGSRYGKHCATGRADALPLSRRRPLPRHPVVQAGSTQQQQLLFTLKAADKSASQSMMVLHAQLQLLTMAKLPVPLGAMPPESSQNQPLSCRAALSA